MRKRFQYLQRLRLCIHFSSERPFTLTNVRYFDAMSFLDSRNKQIPLITWTHRNANPILPPTF
jgi:hypothetical protein